MTLETALAAAEPDAEARVATGLIANADGVLLCDIWLDSYPPQCNETVAVELAGAPLAQLDLDEASGVRFGTVDIILRWNADDTAVFVERGDS